MVKRRRPSIVALAAVLTAACTIKDTPAPPLTGPSEYALSMTIAALPDLLTRDGGSQSVIVVTARNSQGEALRGLQLRLDMIVNGQVQDFGSLSARTVFTSADGRATAVYTAPPAPPVGASSISDRVSIIASSVGTNQQDAKAQVVDIRLVLPTVYVPGAPVAFFTYAPSTGYHHRHQRCLQRQRLLSGGRQPHRQLRVGLGRRHDRQLQRQRERGSRLGRGRQLRGHLDGHRRPRPARQHDTVDHRRVI